MSGPSTPPRWDSVYGWVLAGGASRRMGRPKADLVLAGATMLERQIRLLRAVGFPVAVVGYRGSRSGLGVPVLDDDFPDRGPLAGISAGLGHTRREFNLFLGCDLPFMERRFLEFLCCRALESGADVTLPHSAGGRAQPLCALYRRRIAGIIRGQLESGWNKVDRFFPRVRTERILWPEMARLGFPPRIFDNMNTPEDYEDAVRRLGNEREVRCRES